MRITWYIQEEDSPEIEEKGLITLEDAMILVDELEISPETVEVPQMVGFLNQDGSFLEFTRLSEDIYQVRYYDKNYDEDLIGELPIQKAIQCLIDFFNGRRPRWCSELE